MKFPQLISLCAVPSVFVAHLPLSVAGGCKNVDADEFSLEMYPLHQQPHAIELKAEVAAFPPAALPGTQSQSSNILSCSSFRVGG